MSAIKSSKTPQLFSAGQLLVTPMVLNMVPKLELLADFQRHLRGDWGDVCKKDGATNDHALQNGDRLFSVYKSTVGVKFWIITEADRSYTTILLPSEY